MLYPGSNTIGDLQAELRRLLATELGTFKNGNGTTKAALWVEPPQSPPAGTGVHVFIRRQPQMFTESLYQWVVSLMIHGDLNDGSLGKFDSAIAKMRQRFPRRRESIMPYQEGMLPQAVFYLIFERFAYSQY